MVQAANTTRKTKRKTTTVIVETQESQQADVHVLTAGNSATEEVVNSQAQEERRRQIDAYAFQGPTKKKSKDSWLNTVGKYTNDSPLVRIMEKGAQIREAERIEEC